MTTIGLGGPFLKTPCQSSRKALVQIYMYKFTAAKHTADLVLSVGRKVCGAFSVRMLETAEYRKGK